DRGGGRYALTVQLEGLRLGASREVLGVLGIHLVEHARREVGQRLPGGDGFGDAGDRLVRTGHVVGGDPDRPLLGRGRLLPVGVGELVDGVGHLCGFGFVLLGQRFGTCAHGSPPRVKVRTARSIHTEAEAFYNHPPAILTRTARRRRGTWPRAGACRRTRRGRTR